MHPLDKKTRVRYHNYKKDPDKSHIVIDQKRGLRKMLKTDHSHRITDKNSTKSPVLKILSQLTGAAVALTMCPGFASVDACADSDPDSGSSYRKNEVYIPRIYRDDVLESLDRTDGGITKADLEGIEKLQILMENNIDSLSFINNCTSMTELYLANTSDHIYPVNQIGRLDALDSFTFDNGALTVDLNVKNCRFLYNNENIKSLTIYGNVMVEPELVYSMPNIESAAIEITETTPFDLKKLPSLKEAYIYGDPYDISITTTADDINYLLEHGIEIYLNFDSFETMKKNDSKLNDIIKSLDINETSTDQEKLDAIIVYALKHFVYDREVDTMSSSDPARENKIRSFYENGYLYGALEKDTQICGNYAAFFTAVATRLGLESYMMMSDIHCWNLVKIDGDYYYIDTTWMDCNLHYDGSKMVKAEELFERGDKEYIDWYMDQPKSYTDYDHQSYNFPVFLEDEVSESVSKGVYSGIFADDPDPEIPVIETTTARIKEYVPQPVETKPITTSAYYYVPDLSDEQYELMVNGTLIVVPIVFLSVIIAVVCVVKAVKKRKAEKEANRYYSEDNGFK